MGWFKLYTKVSASGFELREFIVRARKAPIDPDRFMAAVGTGAHVEYLAHMVVNALFISKGHRDDTLLTLVLEDSPDFSRAISISGDSLGNLQGMNEDAILKVCSESLRAGIGLAKEATVTSENGLQVTAISFEHLVKTRVIDRQVYMLDRKGEDIRETDLAEDAVFLLTDHIPMPKKTFKSLARQGVKKLSLGPVMLHASQCISVIHNEMDRINHASSDRVIR
jgi:tRNA (pseudouridine54-N1)-methyltransferase